MEENEILMYKQQLKQINTAIEQCITEDEKNELLALKVNITELLTLTDDQQDDPSTTQPDEKTDEFALFMSEMAKEGAVQNSTIQINANTFDAIEGKKCRAPHEHQWGSIAYHNAMICSVAENDRKVRVLFINPTHQEMLPCPYYFDSECKFPEDKCRFSHGELVLSTDLQDYIEPKFDQLVIGSPILAKKEDDLWYRASIRRIYNDRCFIKFESNQKEMEVKLEHVFPLEGDIDSDGLDEEGVINEVENDEDVINMSLVITPANQGLGDWEKHTKGIGSKLMQQMGYITGTGLGRHADGRINPVTAIILPAGKSLDHCMKLRENAGGDKDLFSVERKLKRIQKKQELRNQRAYESDQSKSDVFNFINKTLSSEDGADSVKVRNSKHRQEVKKETCRNLNVAGLQVDENIRRVERDLEKVRDSLSRHKDVRSQMHKSLNEQLQAKYSELSRLQSEALNIRNEQSLRSDKKKLTVF